MYKIYTCKNFYVKKFIITKFITSNQSNLFIVNSRASAAQVQEQGLSCSETGSRSSTSQEKE